MPPRRSRRAIGAAASVVSFAAAGYGDQPVVEALVVALEMVVLDELRDGKAEVTFTERKSLSRHSDLMESTKRSATAFRLGL